MKPAGYRSRKEVSGVATVRNSDLDKRAIAKEKTLLVISTKAIAAENQAIGERVRLKHSCFLSRIRAGTSPSVKEGCSQV